MDVGLSKTNLSSFMETLKSAVFTSCVIFSFLVMPKSKKHLDDAGVISMFSCTERDQSIIYTMAPCPKVCITM